MILFLLAWMLLQQPGARIAGVVISDDGARKPVRHAIVTLAGGASETMITGDDGAFAFSNLSPGRYRLSASKPGFPESPYGTRPGRDIAVPIALAAGQQMTSMQLRLARGAVITGTVIGATGDPVPGVTVIAGRITASLKSSGRALVGIGESIADEDGVYRIYGLPEGDFVVTAWPAASKDPATIYAPTSYPSTTSVGDAPLISVHAGDEHTNADITLRPSQRAAVTGVVIDADGRPAGGVRVLLSAADSGGISIADGDVISTRTGNDGTFAFAGVIAGGYTATVNDTRAWAKTDIRVDGRDVAGVTLTLRPGTPPDASLDPSGGSASSTSGARGALTDATGAPATDFIVVVFPAERAQWAELQAVTRVVPPDTNGEWAANGLPPGQYRVAAITDWMTSSIVTPALLEQLMAASAPIGIAPGEMTTINLRVGG